MRIFTSSPSSLAVLLVSSLLPDYALAGDGYWIRSVLGARNGAGHGSGSNSATGVSSNSKSNLKTLTMTMGSTTITEPGGQYNWADVNRTYIALGLELSVNLSSLDPLDILASSSIYLSYVQPGLQVRSEENPTLISEMNPLVPFQMTGEGAGAPQMLFMLLYVQPHPLVVQDRYKLAFSGMKSDASKRENFNLETFCDSAGIKTLKASTWLMVNGTAGGKGQGETVPGSMQVSLGPPATTGTSGGTGTTTTGGTGGSDDQEITTIAPVPISSVTNSSVVTTSTSAGGFFGLPRPTLEPGSDYPSAIPTGSDEDSPSCSAGATATVTVTATVDEQGNPFTPSSALSTSDLPTTTSGAFPSEGLTSTLPGGPGNGTVPCTATGPPGSTPTDGSCEGGEGGDEEGGDEEGGDEEGGDEEGGDEEGDESTTTTEPDESETTEPPCDTCESSGSSDIVGPTSTGAEELTTTTEPDESETTTPPASLTATSREISTTITKLTTLRPVPHNSTSIGTGTGGIRPTTTIPIVEAGGVRDTPSRALALGGTILILFVFL
ncbi:hypothetical protein N656DRAFT_772175 [Canariomyces notabilis]|uniref:Uncharacterized protein n=1 Tax=Canariomyces notabilis TaxID=2074819 RepID=A0AAN6T8G7_9PEZI|nr:hypothetical protein N656DRAFT_772175 [Canariomyces arenarius]